VFPSVLGRPRHSPFTDKKFSRDYYVGDEAMAKPSSIVAITRAIERGVILNGEDIEKIWHHTFYNELGVAPEEHPILLTESPFNLKATRERTMEKLFEVFNPPAAFITSTNSLALFASGLFFCLFFWILMFSPIMLCCSRSLFWYDCFHGRRRL
jgi:actin beta/gamma 1